MYLLNSGGKLGIIIVIQAWPGPLGQTAEDDNKMTETELVLAGRQAGSQARAQANI